MIYSFSVWVLPSLFLQERLVWSDVSGNIEYGIFVLNCFPYACYFFDKNPTAAEYSYISADFRLKIFL